MRSLVLLQRFLAIKEFLAILYGAFEKHFICLIYYLSLSVLLNFPIAHKALPDREAARIKIMDKESKNGIAHILCKEGSR